MLLVFSVLALFSGGLCFLLALGQLVQKSVLAKNIYTALTLVGIGFVQVLSALIVGVLPISAPAIPHLHIPVIFLFGPFIYYFYQYSLYPEYSPKKALHFASYLPAALSLLFILSPYYKDSELNYESVKQNFLQLSTGTHSFLVQLASSINLIYYAKMSYDSRFLWGKSVFVSDPVSRYFAFFQLGAILIPSITLLSFLFAKLSLLYVASSLIGCVILLSYLVSQRYPEFFITLQKKGAEHKYRKSMLNKIDLDQIENKLNALMLKSRVFTDEKLSLSELSKQLQITSHQLSEFLNARLGQNFASFLNHYRIEEAKKLLLEEPDKSILEISLDVGYGNKSTFNAVFRKNTGQNPQEFRKNKKGGVS
ncbi:hypothetical protein CH373_05190 [Leptospira perolatii]|uniref:HTH araC/xylS-type domain-containing protein n=1 Tax=Leptospira perolatii TaxID=2023191 RepID=A0A2M9ZQI1_9LEPT|nr:helix-turn-helix domain-containing protein [Leptospira perolatii]PJZ70468.1 hypothetical protein CH360_05610 [Leptospira perolatii]PJZ74304.1 hypothetical protein CH373_05190 [Leptospira perolatii]